MLELRPNCEHCNKSLPPNASDARICSYECTFCANCVDTVLKNVCPNCGGGFVPRPVRPTQEWKTGVSLSYQPAATTPKLHPVDLEQQAALIARVRHLAPEQR